MPQTITRPAFQKTAARRVTPSRVNPANAKPFSLDQELEPFGNWVGEPIWAPPMESAARLAESMVRLSRPFASQEGRWQAVVDEHRNEFTQVREIDLPKASIRLPQGKFFVSVTEREHFDTITDKIPACVQTRLDEFLAGPGKRYGVKVSYLKPLCVEVCDDLILTTRKDLRKTIDKIRAEVFEEYRLQATFRRPMAALRAIASAGLAVPRSLAKSYADRKQRALDAYQAKLEFKRRKIALGAAKNYKKCRTGECTFQEMLSLTNPIERTAVAAQYGIEQKLSNAKRDELIRLAAGSTPWFVTLAMGLSHAAAVAASFSLTVAPSVVVCDPVFVAEMPDNPGVLLKIGHFDEVAGVMHVEI